MERKFDFGNLFWGLLLLFIGSMFLLDNLNILNFEFSNLWRLWPLLIVATGVSLLSIKGWPGAVITGVMVAAMIGLVGLVSLGFVKPGANLQVNTQRVEVARSGDEIKGLDLSISGGAGTILIDSVASGDLVQAKLESNFVKLRHESSERDGIQKSTLTLDPSENWWQNNYRNDLAVNISEQVPLDLNIDTGASKISGDLSLLQLKSLKIDAGASEASVKIGSLVETLTVELDMGASSFTLEVPKDSGISFDIDADMSNQDIPGLRKISDDRYESSNYAAAKNKIVVRGSIGMSNLRLAYY